MDSRAQYTKSDWVLWSACMSPDDATFQKFIDPIYTYANETTSRVPISDWHDTNTGKMMNFKARSVVGGYYMKLLMEKSKNRNKTNTLFLVEYRQTALLPSVKDAVCLFFHII